MNSGGSNNGGIRSSTLMRMRLFTAPLGSPAPDVRVDGEEVRIGLKLYFKAREARGSLLRKMRLWNFYFCKSVVGSCFDFI